MAICRRRLQGGYTYLLVLFLIASMGFLLAQVGIVWHAAEQREREAELLAVGAEISRALTLYRDEALPGRPPLPTRLEQLLGDPRFPDFHRYLRRLYRDPITGRQEWGLVREGPFIVGVYSPSRLSPIRRTNLPPELGEDAKRAVSYSQWVFRATDPTLRERTKNPNIVIPRAAP